MVVNGLMPQDGGSCGIVSTCVVGGHLSYGCVGGTHDCDMRLLICGDRNWSDSDLIYEQFLKLVKLPDVVIEGEARGADALGRNCALALKIPVSPYPALWDVYGKGAGPIRNQQMLDEGKPTHVWAFHDDIENSKGTKDMVTRARAAGLVVEVFSHPPGWKSPFKVRIA